LREFGSGFRTCVCWLLKVTFRTYCENFEKGRDSGKAFI
jgi:hypothetical protein